jgi:archaemetzincin
MKSIVILIVLTFAGCDNKKLISNSHPGENLKVILQPFENIPKEDVNYVQSELKKFYPHVLIKESIYFPKASFYPPRQRYRADSLINYLNTITPAGSVMIGLTNKDISTGKDKNQDWGVMGLGFCPGKACIASTFRLSKNERRVQLFKVAIHELGHSQGLPHCEVKSCFMRDAEGRNPVNEEKEFCERCRTKLESKGMQFPSL